MSDRYQEIKRTASEAQDGGRYKESALLHEQAYRYAREFQMLKESFDAGVWSAIAWEHHGNSLRALDLLMELLQAIPADVSEYDVYLVRKYCLVIVFKYNPELSKLTEKLNELEAMVRGNSDLPQADVPNLRGELMYQQGRFEEALEQAELAWSKYNERGFLKSDIAEEAIRFNLQLSRVEAAKHWYDLMLVIEQESTNDQRELNQCRILQRIAEASFALWEQRYSDVDSSLRALEQQLEGTQGANWWTRYSELSVRYFLLQQRYGDPLNPKHPALIMLASHSQRDKTVFAVYERFRLFLDYRLAALRFAVGIEPVDDYAYAKKQTISNGTPLLGRLAVQDRILRTRRAGKKALREAQYLDDCFRCEWRRNQIHQRLERLEEIADSIT